MKNINTLFSLFAVALIAIGLIFFRESKKILAEKPTAWTQSHIADCAIVLTGGPGRVREGFDLLAQKRIHKLIISGVYPKAQLREIFPQWPYYGNLNENDVVLEKRSGTTYGNAQQTLPLVEALNCRDVVLITSRLHMYRAYKIFKSIYPSHLQIYPRSIVAGNYDPGFVELMVEVTKSLFYFIWAY